MQRPYKIHSNLTDERDMHTQSVHTVWQSTATPAMLGMVPGCCRSWSGSWRLPSAAAAAPRAAGTGARPLAMNTNGHHSSLRPAGALPAKMMEMAAPAEQQAA